MQTLSMIEKSTEGKNLNVWAKTVLYPVTVAGQNFLSSKRYNKKSEINDSEGWNGSAFL